MNRNDLDYLIDLKYGLMNKEQEDIIKNGKSIFVKYLPKFKNKQYPYPETTSKEIDKINKIRKEKSSSDSFEELLNIINSIDDDCVRFIDQYLIELGINESNLISKLDEQLMPFILELKKYYNRPRPYQVAYYTAQKLEAYYSISSDSPSYPSASTLKAEMICKVISYHHKDKRDEIMEIPMLVSASRLLMGVNYESDIEFSKSIVDELCSIDKIKQKLFVKRKKEQKKEGVNNTPPLNGAETTD